MFIESTFVRYGHQAGGLTGFTLKPSDVNSWNLSWHTCSQLRDDMLAMKDKENNKTSTTHKEKAPRRITSDASDGQKIKEALQIFSDPLAKDTHPPGILNVVTGLHGTDMFNADEYIKIGREQMT